MQLIIMNSTVVLWYSRCSKYRGWSCRRTGLSHTPPEPLWF